MLGPRQEAPLRELVHPVFAADRVYTWEILRDDDRELHGTRGAMTICRSN